jgi:hypothetical protein
MEPEVGFKPTTFRLRVDPQPPTGPAQTRPGCSGAGAIYLMPFRVPGISAWVAKEVATCCMSPQRCCLASAPPASDPDRMLTVSGLPSAIGEQPAAPTQVCRNVEQSLA